MTIGEVTTRLLYRAVSVYTRYSPITKGKALLVNRLMELRLPVFSDTIRTADGRTFEFNSGTRQAYEVFFCGTHEKAETALIRRIVAKGDSIIDVGANIGWYTSLISRIVGPSGKVVALEPVPRTFEALTRTLELNSSSDNVILLQILCTEQKGFHTILEFPDLHPGLSSEQPIANSRYIAHKVRAMGLDDIIAECRLKRVQLIKLDIEGGELSALLSASQSLRSGMVESILLEVNNERAMAFGYRFADCLDYLQNIRDGYEIFRILPPGGQLLKLQTNTGFRNGENILGVLRGSTMGNRLSSLTLIDNARSTHALH